MLKRFLPLLLILTISVFPALACVHTDSGEVVDEDRLEANLIPAQPGVAGSVDLICPYCSEVIEHIVFDPLPAEAEHPASSDEEIPPASVPAEQQETVQEQTPQQESSTQSEQPAQPVQPAQPAQPEAPAQPVTPAEPAQPEAPASRSGGAASVPAADTGSSSPAAAPAAEPPKAQEVTVNVPPETASAAGGGGKATGSSGGGAARQGGRAKISGGGEEAVPTEKPQTFPFRRIKMKPKPGLRAEAAGELVVPVYGTPFQNIYND